MKILRNKVVVARSKLVRTSELEYRLITRTFMYPIIKHHDDEDDEVVFLLCFVPFLMGF